LTKGRTAAAPGRFSGIRYLSAMCTPSNTCFLGTTRVHNPNGVSIGSAVFAQIAVEVPYSLQWTAPFPSKLPLRMRESESHLIRGSLSPPESIYQNDIWIGSADFAKLTVLTIVSDRPTDRLTTLFRLSQEAVSTYVLRCGIYNAHSVDDIGIAGMGGRQVARDGLKIFIHQSEIR